MASCSRETVLSALDLVWSKRSTSVQNDHVLVRDIASAAAAKVRITVEAQHMTPQCRVQVFYEYSDDRETWSGTTTLGSAITADARTYGTTFTDITSGRKRFVRFGVRVTNASGTKLENAHVALRVDMQAG